MSTTQTKTEAQSVNTPSTPAGSAKASSLVDVVFDAGTQWAALGLKFGKQALEQSARTLEATAKTLENLANSLDPKR